MALEELSFESVNGWTDRGTDGRAKGQMTDEKSLGVIIEKDNKTTRGP